MNEATRAYLKMLGNPYAKLSILDDEQPTSAVASAQPAGAKHRSAKSGNAMQPSLFEMQNPYAKLSILSEEELALELADRGERTHPVWKTRTQVYEYVGETFSLSIIRNRPLPLLKQLGEKVIRLSPRAQKELHRRIAAYLPDEHIVYNRLPPNELDGLFMKLLEMADAVAALDGQKD